MKEHENVKERDEETLKKDWCKEEQLPPNFEQLSSAYLEMLTEFESIWDGRLGRINASRHQDDSTNDQVRPVFSVVYWAKPTER